MRGRNQLTELFSSHEREEAKSQMEMGSARKRKDTTQRRCDSLGDRFRLFICLLFDSQRQRQTQRKSPVLLPID